MYTRLNLLKIIALTSLAIFALFLLVVAYIKMFKPEEADVLGIKLCGGVSPCVFDTEPGVSVSGFIRIATITFTVHPEKRHPLTGNWDTTVNVQLQNCTTGQNFTFNGISTNTSGTATISLPLSTVIPDGDYRFFIKGYSHLREQFNCYTLATQNPNIDLTVEGKDLLAGEVSVIYDNYINSLDMSVLYNNQFSSSNKNDLNQDTKVNSLDIGNQLYNIFVAGN
ncbi:MAG: hypothetical protein ACE5DX_00315 [Candidatus Dojkabacteria bacterium]